MKKRKIARIIIFVFALLIALSYIPTLINLISIDTKKIVADNFDCKIFIKKIKTLEDKKIKIRAEILIVNKSEEDIVINLENFFIKMENRIVSSKMYIDSIASRLYRITIQSNDTYNEYVYWIVNGDINLDDFDFVYMNNAD